MQYVFTWILLLLFSGMAVSQETRSVQSRPNVILILTDDQGWGDVSGNGNINLQSPNMDRLSGEGARFEFFYVQPVCSPTRAEILTGRSYPEVGVYSTTSGGERFDPKVPTLADLFKSAGYRTGLFGKWHSGSQAPYHPNFRGFDEFYGFTSGHWGHYFDPELEYNQETVRGKGYLPDDLTTRAITFMEQSEIRPYFVFLSFNTPHSPMQVPDADWEAYRDKPIRLRHRDPLLEDRDFTRAALAMVENLDRNLGRVLNYLDRSGKADSTIVLFLSDNGPNSYRWNGGMKGRKGSTDEGGVRSNLFVRWPGTIPAGHVVSYLSGSIDLLPTLCSLGGIPLPDSLQLDGLDLSPHLFKNTGSRRPLPLYHHWGGKTSVRLDAFRLDAENRLFDIRKDPGQLEDISATEPERRAALISMKDKWVQEVMEPALSRPSRAFTVGFPGASRTVLPARDGDPHGAITRSNRYPNASFFTNWKTSESAVSWAVDVVKEGKYRAELHYTLAEGDQGVRLTLQSSTNAIERVLDKAFDPPLVGAEKDRIPRIESYIKPFKAITLGDIYLHPGADTIWLKAKDIAGEQGPDILRIVLEPRR